MAFNAGYRRNNDLLLIHIVFFCVRRVQGCGR
jgi:hypothetical protein